MRKFTLLLCLAVPLSTTGQKYISEKSTITFFSKATIEDIAARNEKGMGMFDLTTSEVAFSIPIKDFIFEKALMQEHFNEKYLETEKFPKASFQGKITGFTGDESGPQPARAIGKLTIHGVTRDVDVPGTFEKRGNQILLNAKFMVILEEYNVKRPQVLWKNIAESVEVTIDFILKPYEK